MQDQVSNKEAAPADVITVKEMILKTKRLNRYLISKWKIILIAVIIGGAIGFLYATYKSTQYTAECTFVLEEADRSGGGLGQYSALASMVGIDVGSSSGLFQGDNILELYKSRLMLEKTLLTPANFNGKIELIIDRYLTINNWRKAWEKNPKLRNINFNIPKSQFTLQHDSIITIIVADLIKNKLSVDKPDKKLSIVSVKTKSINEHFSKAFTDAIVANVNKFYIETKTKGSLQNLKLLQHQADSIRRVLNSSIGGSAAALDANPNPNPAMQVLRVPSQRKQIDIQSNTAIYAEVVKNLEIAKGALQRETPLIQMIDEPVLPLPNDKVSRLKSIITGGFIAVFLALFIITLKKAYTTIIS